MCGNRFLGLPSPDVDGVAWVHRVVKGSKGRGCVNFVKEGLEFVLCSSIPY